MASKRVPFTSSPFVLLFAVFCCPKKNFYCKIYITLNAIITQCIHTRINVVREKFDSLKKWVADNNDRVQQNPFLLHLKKKCSFTGFVFASCYTVTVNRSVLICSTNFRFSTGTFTIKYRNRHKLSAVYFYWTHFTDGLSIVLI